MTTLDTHLSYKTQQALGKAISRVSQKLPSSTRKKTTVIKVLAKWAGVISTEESKKKSASCISEETIKFVKDFYTCSDIVYTMPGMKDEDCIDSKKLNLNIDPATNVSWSQWCYMESNENHQKKIQSITFNTCAGELIECIQNDWDKVLTHVNIKQYRVYNFKRTYKTQKLVCYKLTLQ